MYEKFFELNRRPFHATPDTTLYFRAPGHETALAQLARCVADADQIGILCAPAGMGKTIVARLAIESTDPSVAAIYLANAHGGCVRSLFQSILFDLSIPYEHGTEQELRLRLIEFVMEKFGHGNRTLLVIDEAQNLTDEQLEELRLLTNLEGRSERALQVLLFARPQLWERIEHIEFEPFRQRVGTIATLPPLEPEQVMEYVRARISHAGGAADSIFTAAALCEICDRTGGNPRRINQVCHRALQLAFARESGTIDVAEIEAAADQLRLPRESMSIESLHSAQSTPGNFDENAPFERERPGMPSVVEVGAGIASASGRRDQRSEPSSAMVVEVDATSGAMQRKRAGEGASGVSKSRLFLQRGGVSESR